MTVDTSLQRKPRFFVSLNQRDRMLLLACLVLVVLGAGVVAVLAPQEDDNSRVPSSFASGSHGAEAAFLALERSGYRIERWERPLDDLVAQVDPHTVVILAEPDFSMAGKARTTVSEILNHGGRVVATGFSGGFLLPDNEAEESSVSLQTTCDAQPEGFDPIADSGVVHIRPGLRWKPQRPEQRAQYSCGGDTVVVSYAAGHGQVVWWADSQPLENAAIAKDGNLALLLNSIGADPHARIVWDESLHGDAPGLWSYANGTPVHLLWLQMALAGLLLVFSFSRRSGPLLPDPSAARDMPLEFVYSLGALYDKAGATNTAVQIAYDRFRMLLGRNAAIGGAERAGSERSDEIMGIASARLGSAALDLRETVADCEAARYESERIQPRRSLALVQALWRYGEDLKHGVKGRW
ncbi:MAG TPA: DUF4350 domain-containing protein [Acidobacteriaceae bacterium]|nr:DUF4350 domain-containing protein [Acidobacteriaceae bacterium]